MPSQSDYLKPVLPQETLVIILGAHDWSRAKLSSSITFKASAQAFLHCVCSPSCLGIPAENILNLFDDESAASEQIDTIGQFLDAKVRSPRQSAGAKPRNLLIYYTGHGSFHHSTNEYFLCVRSMTHKGAGLYVRFLADCLNEHAPFLRRFIILDCCFAGAANKMFQSANLDVATRQTAHVFPTRGTVILCSSSGEKTSETVEGETYTRFSGALMSALQEGETSLGELMSFRELNAVVYERLRQKHGVEAIRPELHSPSQPDGDLADLRIFRNADWSGSVNVEGNRAPPNEPVEVPPIVVYISVTVAVVLVVSIVLISISGININ